MAAKTEGGVETKTEKGQQIRCNMNGIVRHKYSIAGA